MACTRPLGSWPPSARLPPEPPSNAQAGGDRDFAAGLTSVPDLGRGSAAASGIGPPGEFTKHQLGWGEEALPCELCVGHPPAGGGHLAPAPPLGKWGGVNRDLAALG
ncbi:hypothetical protein KIL84_001903 [Mauremys mutica]|uniref:Uncharacterized protein n=1 Tax=Mauremys mutica TaxID=74926 RepID=A0A9D3XG89_9SAUR|nr:hypothetical protein KIL84_001903 [Mauremys mutica]